ncbi:MAG: O-antigen ligase family protein [Anaerolineae bacterium]|nr:O-antigen ligase family protein [Anaerolineae bacterium]
MGILILLAAGGFYFSPWLPLTLVCGLALAALILLRLDWGLALVAATAPFYLHPRPLFGKAFAMAELLTLCCLLSWAVRDKKRLLTAPGFRLDAAVALFVLIAVTSALTAEHSRVALRELRVVILEPALFYLMLRTARLKDGEMRRVMDFFIGGAVTVALIGLVQYLAGINLITAEEGLRRLRSVYGSPNNVALYLGRALPVAAAVAAFGASRGRRLAYGLSLVPMGFAMLLTFSKGALILGLPFSLLVLFILGGGKWRRWSLVALAMMTMAVALMFLLRVPRFLSLFDTGGGTTFFRLSLWRSSWTMLREHPWLGVGPDNFLYHYRSRYILPAAWQEPDLSHPHNVLLDYGCRLGLWGLAVAFLLQTAFWRLALPLRHLGYREGRALAIGVMGSMVNFLAHGLVDASYFVMDLAFAFFLALAVVQWLVEGKGDGTEE